MLSLFSDPRLPPRFWCKVRVGSVPAHRPELGPCWEWTGARVAGGYGTFGHAGRTFYAHRWAYEHLIGLIPPGLQSDHLCHNNSGCLGGPSCPHRACVKPSHIEPVTQRENIQRGEGGWGTWQRTKTHCPQGHVYDEENTYIDRRNTRHCIKCNRSQAREYQRARRAAPLGVQKLTREEAVALLQEGTAR